MSVVHELRGTTLRTYLDYLSRGDVLVQRWAGIRYIGCGLDIHRWRLCYGFGAALREDLALWERETLFQRRDGVVTCLLEEGGGKQRRKRNRTGKATR